MEKFKKLLRHPVISPIIGTFIILVVVTPLAAKINSLSITDTIIWIWRLLLKYIVLNPVVLWVIILLFTIRAILSKHLPIVNKEDISLNRYTKDIIDDIVWEWDWDSYTFKDEGATPFCMRCSGILVYKDNNSLGMGHTLHSNYGALICEHCGFKKMLQEESVLDYFQRIKREIYRRARTGEWKSKIESK